MEEGSARFKASTGKITKKLEIFYNPVMKHNRDISILLLNNIGLKKIAIALPLAASGIRGIRFAKELKKGIINEIHFNDMSESAIKSIKQNLKLNDIRLSSVHISRQDANMFLLESSGFNYIDIDPFGSPNPFLDSAVKRIARKGILAITATDTAPLAGTFPKTCLRKYWAKPLRNEMMHEIGLRILIRKVQLIGVQFEKALVPVYSYFKDHYFRVFFECEKGKQKCDKILKEHGNFMDAGPMWLGRLWDAKLAGKMYKSNKFDDLDKFLKMIADESKVDAVGFTDVHVYCKRNKIKSLPRIDDLLLKMNKKGKAAKTHFRPNSIRCDCNISKFLKE